MICLASRSPRRAQLLSQIGVEYWTSAADIDETPAPQELPYDYVKRMALEKALALVSSTEDVVLGADTCVVIDQDILGKPVDDADAVAMLQRLSGRPHQVMSGVALAQQGEENTVRSEVLVVSTQVSFAALSDAQIRAYVATQEPADKAGAYGIQGLGAVLVESLQGSHSNVVGLPLHETAQLLQRWHVDIWQCK